jgi:hypothetical protein
MPFIVSSLLIHAERCWPLEAWMSARLSVMTADPESDGTTSIIIYCQAYEAEL